MRLASLFCVGVGGSGVEGGGDGGENHGLIEECECDVHGGGGESSIDE